MKYMHTNSIERDTSVQLRVFHLIKKNEKCLKMTQRTGISKILQTKADKFSIIQVMVYQSAEQRHLDLLEFLVDISSHLNPQI